MTVRRCAIYTRKSTEEGLEQAFNSLDAQYEACMAYVLSQKHEGWTLLPARYDDGGYSGGSMERPGLKALLADVAAGKVDVIVVYKVDRLTRSLADFAKIVEILDARSASFVSVTQAFNTTTSMGRLTLNVLLSFAQFEREVTGERIRDKIAASKAKGMWMGGPVPLGYAVADRKLVIDEAEAAIVRHIFTRYLALGSGSALVEELRADGYRTRIRRHGERVTGGVPFGQGMLLALLGNRIYRGEIVHKGKAYPAEHPAIIDADLFDAVQARIAAQRVARREGANVRIPSLLVGIVEDGHGRRMSPSHAVKKGKRYRYYITHRAQLASDGPEAWRVPAHDLEWAVIERLRDWLGDGKAMRTVLLDTTTDVQQIAAGLKRAAVHVESFATQHARTTLVQALVQRVTLAQDSILIAVDRSALLLRLGLEVDETTRDEPIHITAPALKVRAGKETKLLLTAEDGSGAHSATLSSLLCDAALLRDQMLADPKLSIASLARSTGRCRKRLTRMLRLAWLAPDIAEAILDGRQPPALTAEALLATDLPLDWQQQRTALGFA